MARAGYCKHDVCTIGGRKCDRCELERKDAADRKIREDAEFKARVIKIINEFFGLDLEDANG